MLPPVVTRAAGRPRKCRIKGHDELNGTDYYKKSAKRCGRCNAFGHNARTCQGGPTARQARDGGNVGNAARSRGRRSGNVNATNNRGRGNDLSPTNTTTRSRGRPRGGSTSTQHVSKNSIRVNNAQNRGGRRGRGGRSGRGVANQPQMQQASRISVQIPPPPPKRKNNDNASTSKKRKIFHPPSMQYLP